MDSTDDVLSYRLPVFGEKFIPVLFVVFAVILAAKLFVYCICDTSIAYQRIGENKPAYFEVSCPEKNRYERVYPGDNRYKELSNGVYETKYLLPLAK